MRVLLVNPQWRGAYQEVGVKLPPLGLGYLAAMLKQEGHKVRIVDHNVDPRADLKLEETDLVGISCDTTRYFPTTEISKEARKHGVPVVVGGAHATFCDREMLEGRVADYVVRQEGELTLNELVNHWGNKSHLAEIRGLSYRDNGSIVRNPDRPFIQDLDSVPMPARELMPIRRYGMKFRGHVVTSLVTSRGCPYNCNFCSASLMSGCRWRCRSAESVLQELDCLYSNFGFRAITIVDDNFTANPKRVKEICNGMVRRRLKMHSWCMARCDSIVRHPDMVECMAAAGVGTVFLGIESGSQEVLDGYGKRTTIEFAHEAVRLLKRHGIRAWCSFMIGGLDETKEMVAKTVRMAKKLGPALAQFSILTPYPGTALFAAVKEWIHTRNWSLYDGAHSVISLKHIDSAELQRLLKRAYTSFYLRPAHFVAAIKERLTDPRGLSLHQIIDDIRYALRVRAAFRKLQ